MKRVILLMAAAVLCILPFNAKAGASFSVSFNVGWDEIHCEGDDCWYEEAECHWPYKTKIEYRWVCHPYRRVLEYRTVRYHSVFGTWTFGPWAVQRTVYLPSAPVVHRRVVYRQPRTVIHRTTKVVTKPQPIEKKYRVRSHAVEKKAPAYTRTTRVYEERKAKGTRTTTYGGRGAHRADNKVYSRSEVKTKNNSNNNRQQAVKVKQSSKTKTKQHQNKNNSHSSTKIQVKSSRTRIR